MIFLKNDALMVNVSKVDSCDYQTIVQSLITNVDKVWVNSVALDINSKDIVDKLLLLNEAGLVEFWNYELGKKNNSKISRVITVEEHIESNAYIQEMMQGIIKNDIERSADFTTFNIEQKNLLSNFMIAKYCGASSIIQRNMISKSVKTGELDLLQLYSQYLFNEINIKFSADNMKVEDIIDLRKYSRFFRNKIQKYINDNLLNGDIPLSIIKKDCMDISKEYCEEINSRIRDDVTLFGTGKGVVLDLASIWLVPVTLFSIAKKLWDAAFNKEQRGFIMYLSSLQKYK